MAAMQFEKSFVNTKPAGWMGRWPHAGSIHTRDMRGSCEIQGNLIVNYFQFMFDFNWVRSQPSTVSLQICKIEKFVCCHSSCSLEGRLEPSQLGFCLHMPRRRQVRPSEQRFKGKRADYYDFRCQKVSQIPCFQDVCLLACASCYMRKRVIVMTSAVESERAVPCRSASKTALIMTSVFACKTTSPAETSVHQCQISCHCHKNFIQLMRLGPGCGNGGGKGV